MLRTLASFSAFLLSLPACAAGYDPSPTCAQGPSSHGPSLLQTNSSTKRNATRSALQELLAPHIERELLQRSSVQRSRSRPAEAKAIPTQWWDATFSSAPLYVAPKWGLSNRLRTLVGAFTAARAVGRNVVVIWEPTPQCPQDITELFQGLATAKQPPAKVKKLEHTGHCEYRADSTMALAQIPAEQPVFVEACAFYVKSLADSQHLAFHALHLQPTVRREVAAMIQSLVRPGRRAIGVHMRQGSLQDAKQGSWFGKIRKLSNTKLTEIPCCVEGSPAWVCPSHARTLSDYVKSMEEKSAADPSPVFFVAADRPACIRSLIEHPSSMDIVHSGLAGTGSSGGNNATAALVDMYALATCEDLISKDPGSWSGLIRSLHRGFELVLGSA